jgi:hypothetical protein
MATGQCKHVAVTYSSSNVNNSALFKHGRLVSHFKLWRRTQRTRRHKHKLVYSIKMVTETLWNGVHWIIMPLMADFHESVNALPDLKEAASLLTIHVTMKILYTQWRQHFSYVLSQDYVNYEKYTCRYTFILSSVNLVFELKFHNDTNLLQEGVGETKCIRDWKRTAPRQRVHLRVTRKGCKKISSLKWWKIKLQNNRNWAPLSLLS